MFIKYVLNDVKYALAYVRAQRKTNMIETWSVMGEIGSPQTWSNHEFGLCFPWVHVMRSFHFI